MAHNRRPRKTAPVNGTAPVVASRPAPAKVIEISLRFLVSTPVMDDDVRSIEQLRKDCIEALEGIGVSQVTPSSGYYLVNGKVCMPDDYDPKTRDFKPGKFPPSWAGGPDEKEIRARIEAEKNLPMMARNPVGLRTSKETDRLHALEETKEQKPRSTKDALADFTENTEAGRRRAAAKVAPPVVEDDDELDDGEDYEEFGDEFELEDLEDEEGLEDELEDVTATSLAILKGDKPAPNKRRTIVKRRG